MVDERTINIAIIISAVTGALLVFFSIPVAVARWSPYLDALLSSVSPAVLGWIQNLLIAGFAFATGWLLKSKLTTDEPTLKIERDEEGVPVEEVEDELPTIDKIVGCVEVGEMVWRGLAEFSDVKVESVEVSRTPRCPDCQKEMTRESYQLPTGRGRTSPLRSQNTVTRKLWECPDDDCGHSTKRESGQHSEAQRLFKGFVQDIVESEGQEYSLGNLIERVDGEVTPQSVWEAYAEVKQNSHVSTDCFR